MRLISSASCCHQPFTSSFGRAGRVGAERTKLTHGESKVSLNNSGSTILAGWVLDEMVVKLPSSLSTSLAGVIPFQRQRHAKRIVQTGGVLKLGY